MGSSTPDSDRSDAGAHYLYEMTHRTLLALLISLFMFTGCAAPLEEPAAASEALIDGSAEAGFAEVVSIRWIGEANCTGTAFPDAQNVTIGVQANRYEGYTVWINALIESAGGQVLENPEASPEDLELGLDSDAGREAARIIKEASGLAGPAVSTMDEEASRRLFQGDNGGFLVNWPYVWSAWQGEVEAGTLDQAVLDDIAWAKYPQVREGEPSAPPFGGIHIGIGAFTEQPEFALDAAECITSEENQKYYMLSNGNPAALKSVYEDPEVQDQFPMAPLIAESLDQAAPRPLTPYYAEVSSSLQREFHPPSSVSESTPEQTATLIEQVINGEVLL